MNKTILFLLLTLFISKLTQAGEENLYNFNWLDPDKKVYVLQNKIYEKKNTFYANLGYGYTTNSDFQSPKTIQLKMGYFFAEEWGIELIYSSITNSGNDTLENVTKNLSQQPFIRRYNSYYGAMAVFSPFYAKINTFNRIFYFDWNFGLGVTKMSAESNKSDFLSGTVNNFASESYSGFAWKTELRFYITRNWNLNITLIRSIFKVDSSVTAGKKVWTSNEDLILAIGYSL